MSPPPPFFLPSQQPRHWLAPAPHPPSGARTAVALTAALATGRTARPLGAIVHALGPPGVGVVTAQVLARQAARLAAVNAVSGAPDGAAALLALPGIGAPSAAAIGALFRHPTVATEMARLVAAGVAGADEAALVAAAAAEVTAAAGAGEGEPPSPPSPPPPPPLSPAVAAGAGAATAAVASDACPPPPAAPLDGVTVAFTGGLTGRTRANAAAAVAAGGGTVRTTLTPRTGVLVAGASRSAAAKLRRAASAGVRVVGKAQLEALLAGGLAAVGDEEHVGGVGGGGGEYAEVRE